MRYVNVCGPCQESNTCFDAERSMKNVQKEASTNRTPQSKRPNQNRCEPFDVTALNGNKQHVGMAYVPGQRWKETYDDEQGFMRGTIFPELDKPFHPNTGGCTK